MFFSTALNHDCCLVAIFSYCHGKKWKKNCRPFKISNDGTIIGIFHILSCSQNGALYQYINNKVIIYTFILQMHSEKNVLFGI